jgi:tetratricopeptide (TPR) repeat protein
MYPYFTALALFNVGEADSAIAYLQEAVAVDSTFGAAWSHLARIAQVTEPGASSDMEVRNRYRAIADSARGYAARYYEQPQATGIEVALAKQMAEFLPGSEEAQEDVIGLYLRGALRRGWDPDSVLPYYDQLWAIDSLQDWGGLTIFHLERGRVDEAGRLIRYSEKNDLPVPFPVLLPRFVEIVKAPSQRTRDSILFTVRADNEYFGVLAAARTMLIQDSMSIPRHIVNTIVDGDAFTMAYVEGAAGRGSALGDLLENEVNPWQRSQILLKRAQANVPGLLNEPLGVVTALRDSLAELEVHWSEISRSGGQWTWQLHRLWLLGMLNVRLGELEEAGTYVRAMQRLAADSIPASADSFFVRLGTGMPLELAAAVSWASGETERALDVLSGVDTGDGHWPEQEDAQLGQSELHQYPHRDMPFTRLLRGTLLAELGQFEEAAGWYATFPWFSSPFDHVVYLAPAFHGRAKALDALGRYEEALHYYRRFVTRWQDADPHLQPQVEEARQRIRELEAELR